MTSPVPGPFHLWDQPRRWWNLLVNYLFITAKASEENYTARKVRVLINPKKKFAVDSPFKHSALSLRRAGSISCSCAVFPHQLGYWFSCSLPLFFGFILFPPFRYHQLHLLPSWRRIIYVENQIVDELALACSVEVWFKKAAHPKAKKKQRLAGEDKSGTKEDAK